MWRICEKLRMGMKKTWVLVTRVYEKQVKIIIEYLYMCICIFKLLTNETEKGDDVQEYQRMINMHLGLKKTLYSEEGWRHE
jgi:hypothetical protein